MSSFAQNRKLKDFYKDKAKSSVRFKAFLSFLEGTPEAEIAQFIRVESEKLFSCFFDKFLEEEQVVKKGKTHTQEVLQLLDTLKLMIQNLSENIAKRWKFQMLARIVLKCLHRDNRHEVRMAAFECLLMLMEIFGQDPDDNVQGFVVPAFAKAIDLSPFTGINPPKLNEAEALCPMTEALTKEDVCNMWNFLLDFVTQREDNFEFWYELLKVHYLSIFYPDECMSVGLTVDHEKTFPVCPPELHVCMIKHLPAWDSNKYLGRTIWSEVNAPIMLGYCTHACKMPLSFSQHIHDTVTLFNGIFLRKASAANDSSRNHWMTWLRSISRVFFIPSQPASDELTKHSNLCKLVVEIYGYFCFEMHGELENQVWEGLQNLLVETIVELLSTNDATLVQTLAEVMSGPLLDVMFVAWIRSPITTPEMWQYLQAKMNSLLAWKSVIAQWQEKLLILTSLLVQQLYSSHQSEPRAGAVKSGPRRTTMFGAGGPGEKLSITNDPRILSLDWTPESVHSMWLLLLRIIGKPVDVVVGELFQNTMGCIATVLEMLHQAEADFFPNEDDHPPIDVFAVFCPWLFDATAVDSKRGRGAIVAYTLLSEMFLQMRPFGFDPALLTHFYRVLIAGLTGGHSSIAWCVIRNCRSIFWLNLPGAEVLMPFILDQVDVAFGAKAVKNPPPEKVQSRFVSLLAAMICYSSHFGQVCEDDKSLFDRVVNAFLQIAAFPKVSLPKSLCSALCGIGTCIFQEVNADRRSETIARCIKSLLGFVVHDDNEVSSVALQVISSMSHIALELVSIDPALTQKLVVGLCASGSAMLQAARYPLVSSILYTIMEVLLASDLQAPGMFAAVFSLCESSMCCGRPGQTLAALRKLVLKKAAAPVAPVKDPKEEGKRGGLAGILRKKDKAGSETSKEELPVAEAELSPEIKEVQDAGETVAEMICAHFGNFPSHGGPEIMECREYGMKHQGDDDMNPNTLFWIFGDRALLSMRQVDPCKAGPIVRVTLRNMTGRFVWDMQLKYEVLRESLTYGIPVDETLPDPTVEDVTRRKISSSFDPERKPRPDGVLPTAEVDYQRDGIFEALSYLHEKHPVVVPSKNVRFTQPFDSLALPEEELSHYETSLEFQDEDEQAHQNEKRFCIRPKLKQVLPGSSFHWARIMLAQLGFTTEAMLNMLCLVDNTDKFRRTLKELDKRMCREHVKVACLRVARGKDTQRDMLWNEERSVAFRDFVDAMAWSVDLESHLGFGGQLPKRGSAPYWASPTTELVFHDTTRMPTDEGDDQQIQKKKHVGNDHVSVIWSEHPAEYDPEVIKSQFNFVHVIVYPLINGLLRIQVKKKDQIPLFGPLIDGALVSPALLPILVKATLINANRVVRDATTQNFVRPVQGRAKLLQDIASRYRKEVDFQSMMMEIQSVNITPGFEPPSEPEDSCLAMEEAASQMLQPSAPAGRGAVKGIRSSALQRGGRFSVRGPSTKTSPTPVRTSGTGRGAAPQPPPKAGGGGAPTAMRNSSTSSSPPTTTSEGEDSPRTPDLSAFAKKKLPAPVKKAAPPPSATGGNAGSSLRASAKPAPPAKAAPVGRAPTSPRHASGPAALVESPRTSSPVPNSPPRKFERSPSASQMKVAPKPPPKAAPVPAKPSAREEEDKLLDDDD